MKKIILSMLVSLIFLTFTACEDEIRYDYQEQKYVEALLIVGKPIERIRVSRSLPLDQPFDFEKTYIKDATVKITDQSTEEEYVLEYRDEPEPAYYYSDPNLLIKEETVYELDVVFADNSTASGLTITPSQFEWKKELVDEIQYPKDSVNAPGDTNLRFSWTRSNQHYFAEDERYYWMGIECLDTLEYGKYLDNVDDSELNRRIERPFEEDANYYDETVRWGGPFFKVESSPVVWTAFKWYGKHKVTVYSPDPKFHKWMIHYQRFGTYTPSMFSVEGDAIGLFGSAAIIEAESFVIKNQK